MNKPINEIVTSSNNKQFKFGPFLVAKKFLVRIHQKGRTRYLLQSIVMESDHSMAKDNFNKSKETTPTTSAALMVAP